VLTLALALALAVPQHSAGSGSFTLPLRGVLVPGKTLAGVALGDSIQSVKSKWGTTYRLCKSCNDRASGRQTWFYTYLRDAQSLGAAVNFNRQGKVVAVFTLGSPAGWHMQEGLLLGEHIDRVVDLYGHLNWRVCIGYGALSMRKSGIVTSIYTNGESVYGFALTAPNEPVCQ
jgi:hypothetical protein